MLTNYLLPLSKRVQCLLFNKKKIGSVSQQFFTELSSVSHQLSMHINYRQYGSMRNVNGNITRLVGYGLNKEQTTWFSLLVNIRKYF